MRLPSLLSPLRTRLGLLAAASVVSLLLPAPAAAQALTDITSLFVGFSARRNAAAPAGELKAQLDSLDRDLAVASRFGRTGEVRRLLAKGNVLISGRQWTDTMDFANSLLIRTDRIVVESGAPWSARLEQLYPPTITLSRPLSARVAIRARPVGTGVTSRPGAVVKAIGVVDGVSRDLRESPLALELDIRDVPDGTYQLAIEALDSARILATTTLTVVVRRGIDDAVTRLESVAKTAPDALRAEILFPAERMRNVNRGRLPLRMLDVEKDFAAADSVVAAVKANTNPFNGRTGDMERHYLLEAAGEIMPYRLYIPSTYAPSRAMPLIVALHGLGGTEDSFFDSYERKLPPLAEREGYIVVAPLGYRVDGFYGYGLGTPPADPAARRAQDLSEEDVMQVLAQVRKQYTVDDRRIYLMGHSMGAIGTWRLGAKYPDIWAALGAFAGQGAPTTMETMRHIPQFVVHGDADNTVNVRGSRTMTTAMKSLNMDFEYVEVPGGDHNEIVVPNLEGMFRFFGARKKSPKASP